MSETASTRLHDMSPLPLAKTRFLAVPFVVAVDAIVLREPPRARSVWGVGCSSGVESNKARAAMGT